MKTTNITIEGDTIYHDYCNVPVKVAKAIMTLLETCVDEDTDIVSAERSKEWGDRKVCNDDKIL